MARVAAAEPPSIRALDSLILFPQGYPLLLLVVFLLVLLLVWCTRMVEESAGECTRIVEELRRGVYPNGRGKLPKITAICGKSRTERAGGSS